MQPFLIFAYRVPQSTTTYVTAYPWRPWAPFMSQTLDWFPRGIKWDIVKTRSMNQARRQAYIRWVSEDGTAKGFNKSPLSYTNELYSEYNKQKR